MSNVLTRNVTTLKNTFFCNGYYKIKSLKNMTNFLTFESEIMPSVIIMRNQLKPNSAIFCNEL